MPRFFKVIFLVLPLRAISVPQDSIEILLENVKIQIEATEAINDMYNFKFDRAEMQFRWILQKYPEHPLPYYLLGLSQWWKIMPNVDNEEWDEVFLGYMNQAIAKSEILFENEDSRLEASFFLAAANALKGRLYSERGKWGKAANSGRLALKYQKDGEEMHYLSSEFLFGDALYNYYSVWIREHYPLLKPIMLPFPKGDKKLGIEQMRMVASNAFYTRTEAQLFLMRILALDENDMMGAKQIAEYLHNTFPDNPYFHRFYARLIYSTGRRSNLEPVCLQIIERIDSAQYGYEANSGRYAAFFLGQFYESRGNMAQAKFYYLRAIEFGNEIEAFETGYYLYSLFQVAKIEVTEQNYDSAKRRLQFVRENSKRKDSINKEAKSLLKRIRKEQKSRG